MSGLIEFLRARLDEDEDTAKRAAFGWGSAWRADCDDEDCDWVVHADGKTDMLATEDGDVARHVAGHDPARVLADIAARRAVVDIAAEAFAARQDRMTGSEIWENAGERGVMTATLRHLATVYAEHPDYDEAWRP